jgi:UPF0716 family protein affecting phage T7 exclusion
MVLIGAGAMAVKAPGINTDIMGALLILVYLQSNSGYDCIQ